MAAAALASGSPNNNPVVPDAAQVELTLAPTLPLTSLTLTLTLAGRGPGG